MTKAVVLGGGLAGMLAAAALSSSVDEIVVVERDRLPSTPRPRRGLPQGHHSHILMRGGAEALDRLLPGITGELYAAGAKHRGLPFGALAHGPAGWMERLDTTAYFVLASRDLLDHLVRQRIRADKNVSILESTQVTGLLGSAARVTGVRVESPGDGARTLEADLVIDATGRHSFVADWLRELGLPPVRTDVVDAGIVYASRWYEAPPGTREDFPGVMIQLHANPGKPGFGAGLLPMEGGRWVVSLFGSRGGEPSADEDEYAEFARHCHPIIAALIAQAQPITPIRTYRRIPDQWRRLEKSSLPEGFLAMGDAVMALNPVHGTGMSLAALGAQLLRTEVERTGLRPGFTRRVQAGIARIDSAAWRVVIATDQAIPAVRSTVRLPGGGLAKRMGARVARVGCGNRRVTEIVFNVAALSAPPTAMMRPSFLWAVLRGPRRPPLTSEQAIAQFPEFGDLLRPLPDAAK